MLQRDVDSLIAGLAKLEVTTQSLSALGMMNFFLTLLICKCQYILMPHKNVFYEKNIGLKALS